MKDDGNGERWRTTVMAEADDKGDVAMVATSSVAFIFCLAVAAVGTAVDDKLKTTKATDRSSFWHQI